MTLNDVPAGNSTPGHIDAPTPEPPVVTITPDQSYAPEFRDRAVEALGDDGAWLMLSILHYGWRAHYDIARSIATHASWADDDPLGSRDEEFQIARDLQVQAHMYAVAEQLATLIDSVRAIDDGGGFLETYVGHFTLRDRIDRVAAMSRDELANLLGVPTDAEVLRGALRDGGFLAADLPPSGSLDLADMPTTEIAGLLIPQSAMNRAVSEGMWDRVEAMVDAIHLNLSELRQFVDRPTSMMDFGIRPQSLREVDNSFRHGLRVLFHRAVPSERSFRAIELDMTASTHRVDLYLPRQGEPVRFATVACSPDRTDVHIETIRMLALRIGQVIRCVIGRWVIQNPGFLVTAASLTLGGRNYASVVTPG